MLVEEFEPRVPVVNFTAILYLQSEKKDKKAESRAYRYPSFYLVLTCLCLSLKMLGSNWYHPR